MKDTYIVFWDNGEVSIETERPAICAVCRGPFTNAGARAELVELGYIEIGDTCYFRLQ